MIDVNRISKMRSAVISAEDLQKVALNLVR